MQAQAAEFSGYADNPAAFWEEEFKNTLLRFFYFSEFQPKGTDVMPDYYPQVIDQTLFDTVQDVINGKRKNGR